MINPPFSFSVREQGLKSLGSQFELLGPYQATGAFVMRPWAAEHAGVLQQYLAAYVQGQRHVMNPAHRADMLALLVRSFKLSEAAAAGTYAAMLQAGSGLAPHAAFSHEGFATVLSIRAEMEGMWGGQAPAAGRYLDLSYYDSAVASFNTKETP
jgi:ABC-type nitrate/sulfonate/bicarbonate transport system substrate-binding protein